MSLVHYCIIARDSDMVVFECLLNKELKQSQLKDTIGDIIAEKENQNKETIEMMLSGEPTKNPDDPEEANAGPPICNWLESLPAITGGVELHLQLQTGVFFGIVTELQYPEDKAHDFLDQLHSELVTLYKGNLQFISR